MRSHAANPVAEQLDGDLFRVYFSPRDEHNRSHIGYVDVDLRPPINLRGMAEQAVLAPGVVGTFDDSGVSLAGLVDAGQQRNLYYVGWNLGVTVPWRNSIGLAVCPAGAGDFTRASVAPVMDRSAVDPYSLSYPFVLRENEAYRMWYGSNLAWGPRLVDMRVVIKYAESGDGVDWRRTGRICIGFASPDEYAFARPCIIREAGRYMMWYSYRGASYRIGYAESADGLTWERQDHLAGIDVSDSGWDSEMIEYPFVFDHAGHRYLLYNGNGYGRTGFGLAVFE